MALPSITHVRSLNLSLPSALQPCANPPFQSSVHFFNPSSLTRPLFVLGSLYPALIDTFHLPPSAFLDVMPPSGVQNMASAVGSMSGCLDNRQQPICLALCTASVGRISRFFQSSMRTRYSLPPSYFRPKPKMDSNDLMDDDDFFQNFLLAFICFEMEWITETHDHHLVSLFLCPLFVSSLFIHLLTVWLLHKLLYL
ncbi:hypothetical protein BKA70DRAFT_453641 [Coprinopsis sp. MPI-PUGE-AT-0042]|nr:hypothetical protein BKA70DRAFT_453641 [Coprinopsis sp. MPI-PUGE-AT-0042]